MKISLNLNSIDWDSVSLLEAGHLTDDRTYLEELVRGSLGFRGQYGLVQLDKSDLLLGAPPNSAQSANLPLTLKNCLAISPKGYIVHIESAPNSEDGVKCFINSSIPLDVVPVYLNVEEGKSNASEYARVGTQARYQQWTYTLSVEQPGRMALDSVQVGRVFRPDSGQPLQINPNYIAPCARLDGHWLMKQKVQGIQKEAFSCWESLRKLLEKKVFDLVPFAASLGQAAVLINWQEAPFAYLERMIGILRTHFALLVLLPDCAEKIQLRQALRTTLAYVEPNIEKLGRDLIDWGGALDWIHNTFQLLAMILGMLDDGRTVIPPPKIDLKKIQPK